MTYSGIFVENDRVVRALTFYVVAASELGVGYGFQRAVPLDSKAELAIDQCSIAWPGRRSDTSRLRLEDG